jgi:hypothetical protein
VVSGPHLNPPIMKDADIVDQTLAEVLPHNPKYWFQTPHLLRLNLLLLIPLISSSVAGYEGELLAPKTKPI